MSTNTTTAPFATTIWMTSIGENLYVCDDHDDSESVDAIPHVGYPRRNADLVGRRNEHSMRCEHPSHRQ